MGMLSSGIAGFDAVLGGGWPSNRLYLVLGDPGTGKTTLGFQFLLAGQAEGERGLYITLSENRGEIESVARSHGWSLDGIELFDLEAAGKVLGLEDRQTIFDPSDVEFRATSRAILEAAERARPHRVVLDSLSELAFLARDALAFRRELLNLKQKLMKMGVTVLLLSDGTAPDADGHLHSLAHGVIELEELAPEYGAQRRRLRVRKLRASPFRGGFHDFEIRRGGLELYPRLIAAEHARDFDEEPLRTGLESLDTLLGGGLSRGSSTLFTGPAGTGKSSLVGLCAHASACAGEPAAVFLFDEEERSFLHRARAFGHDLEAHVASGLLIIEQIDPAQLSPGEFIHWVKQAVEKHQARYIAIDSLNGYIQAMHEERAFAAQLHELLSYLAKTGVTTHLVLAQAGMVGPMRSPADITYIADAVVLVRFFEAEGELRRAISVLKKRTGAHDPAIRELSLEGEIRVGEPLRSFEGVLTGAPRFSGESRELFEPRSRDDAG